MKLLACLATFVLGLLSIVSPSIAEERAAITQSGETILVAQWKKREVTVAIRTAKSDIDCHGGIPLGRSNSKGVAVVRELGISVDGHQVFVPRSVFADLLDPREAKIGLARDGFVLSIEGGDGADSYVLRMYSDGNKIARRALFSPLVPERAVEETRYWLRVLKDE